MDGYRLEIDLDGIAPLNSADATGRWKRKKLKDLWHVKVNAAIGQHKPAQPLQAAHVTITRCSSVPPDGDNLVSSAKFLLDGLVACRVIQDDKPRSIGMPVVRWEKTSPKHSHTRIFVQECQPEDLDTSAWDFGDAA